METKELYQDVKCWNCGADLTDENCDGSMFLTENYKKETNEIIEHGTCNPCANECRDTLFNNAESKVDYTQLTKRVR